MDRLTFLLTSCALSCAGCGTALGRCPGAATVESWYETPWDDPGEEAWAACMEGFAGCETAEADARRAAARAAFCEAMALPPEQSPQALLDEAARLDPGWAAPWWLLGNIEKDPQVAVTYLEHAVSLDPGWTAALNDLAVAQLEADDPEAALATLDAALAIDPLMARAHANRGAALAALGQAEEAAAAWLTAMELDPSDPVSLYNLGSHLEEMGEYQMAAAAYGKLLGLVPPEKSAAVHLLLGRTLAAAGDPDGAETEILETLDMAPTSTAALSALGRLYLGQERWDDAWNVYRRLGELDPDGAGKEVFIAAGSLLTAGEKGLAARAYGLVIEIRPSWPEPYINLGAIMVDIGAPEQAAEVLEAALDVAPGDAEILHNLGYVLIRLHRLEEARETLSQALESAPGSAATHSLLGEVLRLLGDLDASLESHDEAVDLAPDEARYHARRARTLLEMDRDVEAAQALERAEALDPGDPTTLMVRGIALMSVKKTLPEAVETLEKAVDAAPHDAESMALLALALVKSKKKKDARPWLETALDVDPWIGELPWVQDLEKKLGK